MKIVIEPDHLKVVELVKRLLAVSDAYSSYETTEIFNRGIEVLNKRFGCKISIRYLVKMPKFVIQKPRQIVVFKG